ncbi:hypothetical protein EV421DRAFT_732643 [Armillaria borealis]|uniref:DUF6535 domain-containing protein n=1 Tax=Armillaria borealis TaxID=47425 RepID=A0AA39JES8_9AGAR|nr:hypothetical protein EV421DRAFT_732643 [Armillaria borealis]
MPETDRTSNLDSGQDGAIVRQDAEDESQGIGEGWEHQHNPAEQEVEPNEVAGVQEQDEAPTPAPPPSANAAGAKKIFGTMRRPNPTARKGNDAYNYEEKYPEDAIYEETTSNARVWRVHEDESRIHDANMVEESRDNVDVLLVFAGLFSAVVTTFVVQTSQSLQPDYAAMSASLLYESVLVQRAIANGSSVNSIAPSPLNPTVAFVPATTDVWVNGLWFTSLFLSLTTALVAVLVKQWLHHYVALPSGTPRDRSFTRQFRYAGFQKWHVQVIIGLLPVLMHLALAIFLVGLVIFLQPLRQALSWVICAGTGVVYTAYVVATILPIIFPQCPYRTPLCDLVYISFRRLVPRVTWYDKHKFLSSFRERRFSDLFDCLSRVYARNPQSLTKIESEFVQQTSTDLAPEALHWLFSVSSNPTVQSIVIQSIGGLPMASEEKFQALRGAMYSLRHSLLWSYLRWQTEYHLGPVPGMELRLERLLRFDDSFYIGRGGSKFSPNIDSFELDVAISFNDGFIVKDGAAIVSPGAFFANIISGPARASKLPPRCWFHLARRAALRGAFNPLDPDKDDHANMFPLHLCSAILHSFHASPKSLTQDFNSPLVLDFKDALPYFRDKIYDNVLGMFSEFVKHPSLSEPSLPQSLLVIVAAIKFLLHRLFLPESNMSHTTIPQSLSAAVWWIRGQMFSSQEATAVIMVLEDIVALCVSPPLNIESDWSDLCHSSVEAYHSLTIVAPSAYSSSGLRSMVDFMTSHWDQIYSFYYKSDAACKVLTDLLTKRIPVAFTVFHESQCLTFLGSHTFHEASVPMVSAYVAGLFAMQQGSDGLVVDAESLRLHIDYLHNPQILFTACSILAAHGARCIDRTVIHRDIITLAQLRPRDASRDDCRRKLDDLVQSDAGIFFTEQRICPGTWDNMQFRPLQADEIQVEKDNIRYAIHVLDDFFDGGVHNMVSTDSLPEWHPTGRIHRFLGWCLGRKPGGKQEQGQQV